MKTIFLQLGWTRGGVIALVIGGMLALAGCTLAGEPVPAGQIERSDAEDAQAVGPTLSPTITLPPGAGYPLEKPNPVAGSVMFAERCASCHGAAGDGVPSAQFADSLAANNAVPANFTDPAVGRSRTPAEFYQTISEGRVDKLMPPFGNSLTDAERWDVVAYLFTLSAPRESVETGQAVYEDNCVACHGADGAGSSGMPDLGDTQLTTNRSAQEWFDTVSNGAGDMPAFGGSLSDDDIWNAVAYARTFAFGEMPAVAEAPPTPVPTPSGDVAPTEDGVLSGVVFNNTTEQPVEGAQVILHGLSVADDGSFGEAINQEMPSGADGSYRFENLPANRDNLVYIVSLVYENSTFTSDVVLLSGEEPELELPPIEVYDATSDASVVSIENLHILFEVEGDNTILVTHFYILSNSSDRMYLSEQQTGQGLQRAAAQIASPAQAFGHFFEDGELGGRFAPAPEGFYDTAPVYPGTASHQIIMSYLLPFGNNKLDIPLIYSARNVTLIYQSDGLRVSGTGFVPDTTLNDPSLEGYEVLTSAGFSTGDHLEVTVRPAASVGSSPLFTIGLGVLVGALVGAAVWWWMSRSQATAPEKPAKSAKGSSSKRSASKKKAQPPRASAQDAAERERLMQAIADLDDAHAAGKVGAAEYEAQRARLMADLVALSGE